MRLGLDLSPAQSQALLAYRDALLKWNKVYNLTALRDPDQALSHHIIDSLAAVPPLQQYLQKDLPQQAPASFSSPPIRVLDVGSGGGLPGVVLAALLPQANVCCVDAVGKKAAFVQQLAGELGLKNLQGLHSRVEQLQAAPFDVITSRAFASLADFVQLTRKHLKPQGVWMALKGKVPDDELAALPSTVRVFHVEPLTVPGLDAQRCIIWLKPL